MRQPLFAKVLVCAPKVRAFEIAAAPVSGWEVSARVGDEVVERHHYSDWHRVERVLRRFKRQVSELRAQGWTEP